MPLRQWGGRFAGSAAFHGRRQGGGRGGVGSPAVSSSPSYRETGTGQRRRCVTSCGAGATISCGSFFSLIRTVMGTRRVDDSRRSERIAIESLIADVVPVRRRDGHMGAPLSRKEFLTNSATGVAAAGLGLLGTDELFGSRGVEGGQAAGLKTG